MSIRHHLIYLIIIVQQVVHRVTSIISPQVDGVLFLDRIIMQDKLFLRIKRSTATVTEARYILIITRKSSQENPIHL